MAMSSYLREIRELVGTRLLMIPAAVALIADDDGRILIVRLATENELWGLPGGGIEPGESPEQAVVREAREETGLLVQPRALHHAFAGPDFELTYASGDRGAYVMLAYWCDVISGDARPDMEEVVELRFVARDDLTDVPLPRWNHVVLRHAFDALAHEPNTST